MATAIAGNVSLSLPSDYFIRLAFDQYAKKLNFTLGFIQLFVLIFGLLGNFLALLVINRKSLRNTSSAVFITYMAIFDTAVLLLHAGHLIRPRRNLFIHCSLTYLTDLFTFCTNWVLVIITLERCIAVYSPFHAKRFCTVSSARFSVYTLLVVALMIFSFTFPVFYHITDVSKRKKCLIRSHLNLILRICHFIGFYAIPDVLLLSNLFTIYSLIQRRNQQARNSSVDQCEMRISDVHSSRKQRQLTIMLVTVNLAFYLFSTPAVILYISEYSPPKDRGLNKLKQSFLFSQISVLLLQLNNATNFIFYCLAGQRFRQATAETFHEFSVRLLTFYHRYILCNKHYRPPINPTLLHLQHTINKRSSNPQKDELRSLRTSTI